MNGPFYSHENNDEDGSTNEKALSVKNNYNDKENNITYNANRDN